MMLAAGGGGRMEFAATTARSPPSRTPTDTWALGWRFRCFDRRSRTSASRRPDAWEGVREGGLRAVVAVASAAGGEIGRGQIVEGRAPNRPLTIRAQPAGRLRALTSDSRRGPRARPS